MSTKEKSQGVKSGELAGYLCQSSYCPNIISGDDNNMLEHHPDEKCSRLVKNQVEETHSELACFWVFSVHISVFKKRAYNFVFWNFAPYH